MRPSPVPATKQESDDDETEEEAETGKEKAEGKGQEKTKKKENVAAPSKLPKHANYMFDQEHTMIHVFSKAAPIWTDKYRKENL